MLSVLIPVNDSLWSQKRLGPPSPPHPLPPWVKPLSPRSAPPHLFAWSYHPQAAAQQLSAHCLSASRHNPGHGIVQQALATCSMRSLYTTMKTKMTWRTMARSRKKKIQRQKGGQPSANACLCPAPVPAPPLRLSPLKKWSNGCSRGQSSMPSSRSGICSEMYRSASCYCCTG